MTSKIFKVTSLALIVVGAGLLVQLDTFAGPGPLLPTYKKIIECSKTIVDLSEKIEVYSDTHGNDHFVVLTEQGMMPKAKISKFFGVDMISNSLGQTMTFNHGQNPNKKDSVKDFTFAKSNKTNTAQLSINSGEQVFTNMVCK